MRPFIYGASITVFALFGGIVLGFVLGSVVFDVMSGHSFLNPNPGHMLLAALPALAGFLAGSALWGILMGRLAHAAETRRMAVTGMLGFAPVTLTLALALQVLEPLAVDQFGAQLPIHRLFTFFFVPTVFLIAGVSAFAVGRGLHSPPLARKLFWRVGLAAALAFVVVNLTMELLGWQVGAPDAARRFTMLTVLLAGNLAAAIVGGGVMGALLAQQLPLTRAQAQPAVV